MSGRAQHNDLRLRDDPRRAGPRNSRSRSRHVWLAGMLMLIHGAGAVADERDASSGPRQPIRLAAVDDGVLVANHSTGTISWIPWAAKAVAAEFKVAERLSDLIVLPRSGWVVALDEQANQLIGLRHVADQWQVQVRQDLPASPVSLLDVPAAPHRLIVASHWARQLTLWQLGNEDQEAEFRRLATLDLAFAPRLMCLCPDGLHLVVADAFGPCLAVVRLDPLEVRANFVIPGHNIRGLAVSAEGDELLIAHQMLNDFVPTTRDHVFWGNVLSNLLRSISFQELLSFPAVAAVTPRKIHGSLLPLGQEGQAAGDPGPLRVDAAGNTVLAVAGTNEVAVRRTGERHFTRLHVGRRPTDLCLSPDGQSVWLANRFGDSVSVVQLQPLQPLRTISLGPARERTVREFGEQLFYDANLSLHGWFSCHSCHTDGHTCGLLNDNFGDDTLGAPKRIPSLLGTAGTGPWAWNGHMPDLSTQIAKSLRLTMRGSEQRTPTPAEIDALTQYLLTLVPPPSVARARGRLDADAVARGGRVFQELNCQQCHVPPEYTSADAQDVGIRDERGAALFNPPSLRGLTQRTRFFHDNRCETLRGVLSQHPQAGGVGLNVADEADLVAFLESL